MTRTRQPAGSLGFTLIELLVVVAIIALLIAMLLPSLARARDHARTVACMANLRGTDLTLNVYISEFNGRVPFSSGGPDINGNMGNHDPLNTVPAWHAYFRSDLGVSNKQMLCPMSAPGNLVWPGAGSPAFWPSPDYPNNHKSFYTDYGMNCLVGYQTSNLTTRNDRWIAPQQGANPKWGSVRNIKSPSAIMSFVDAYDEFIGGSPSGNGLIFRHNMNKAINLAFFDGHAETWQESECHKGSQQLLVATPWWFGVQPWQDP